MEECFEGAEPFVEEADSSQVAPDAGTPSPKRLKFSDKGDADNAAETPPAEQPMDPLLTFIQVRSVSPMGQLEAELRQMEQAPRIIPGSNPIRQS